jgi:hypothetical protein
MLVFFRWDVVYDNENFSVKKALIFSFHFPHDRQPTLTQLLYGSENYLRRIFFIYSRISSHYMKIIYSLAFLILVVALKNIFNRFHNSLALVIVLRQIHQFYHFQFHLSKMHFTIILT